MPNLDILQVIPLALLFLTIGGLYDTFKKR